MKKGDVKKVLGEENIEGWGKVGKGDVQTRKMFKTLPKQDCLFPDFTQKFANYVNFEIATKQRNLSANTMFTKFTG